MNEQEPYRRLLGRIRLVKVIQSVITAHAAFEQRTASKIAEVLAKVYSPPESVNSIQETERSTSSFYFSPSASFIYVFARLEIFAKKRERWSRKGTKSCHGKSPTWNRCNHRNSA